MLINRDNYETFFILYMDNELQPEERQAVEAFAALHPDLKEELDLLMQFKLEPDAAVLYSNKEELQKENGETPFTAVPVEEWMTQSVDGELNPQQQSRFEETLKAKPELNAVFAQFQKTKLEAETIVFADKQSLYRHEEKVRVFYWRRIAAILIFLLAGTTIFFYLNKPKKTAGGADVAKTNVKSGGTINPEQSAPDPNNTAVVNPDQQTNTTDNNNSLAENKTNPSVNLNTTDQNSGNPSKKKELQDAVVIQPVQIKEKNTVIIPVQNNQPENAIADNNPPSNHLPVPVDNHSVIQPINSNAIAANLNTGLQPNPENQLPVTKTNTAALYTSNDVAPENTEAAPESRKGGLRGFIRKVGRNLERRTSSESGDDGRLLVAGLSFNRKSNP